MTDSAMTDKIAIIGGGAAGMSCALWLKRLGLDPILVDHKSRLGGQLIDMNRINHWVLGTVGKTSRDIGQSFADHIAAETINVMTDSRLSAVAAIDGGFQLSIERYADSSSVTVRSLVLATGVRVVGSECFEQVAGFRFFHERGLISFFPLDHLDNPERWNNRCVAIVGGGDNAYFTAMDMAKSGAKVVLLVRSQPKARRRVLQNAESFIKTNILSVVTDVRINEFKQQGDKMTLSLLKKDASTAFLTVDRLFVRAGYTANSQWTDSFDALSTIEKVNGYIKTDARKRTSAPWIYAVGDVANSYHQSVVGAIADGALAAQDLSDRL